MLTYTVPDESHLPALRLYRAECLADGGNADGSAGLVDFPDPADWLERIRLLASDEAEKHGWYRTAVFLAFEGGAPIGIGSIRLSDDDTVTRLAGHIGYHVRPSERRKGYGRAILRYALARAVSYGIAEPHVCVLVGNEASHRTALSAGMIRDGDEILPNGERIVRYRTGPSGQ